MNTGAFSSPPDRPAQRRVSIRRRGAVPDTATSSAADEALQHFVERRRRRNLYGIDRATPPSPVAVATALVSQAVGGSIARLGLPNWVLRSAVLASVCAGLAYAVVNFERGDAPVPLHLVSANVTVGHAVPIGARVVLHPRSGALPGDAIPQGTVAADGSVTFVTYPPSQGVPAGDYVATVQWFKVAADGSVGGNAVPARYASVVQSPLTIKVTGDGAESHVLKVDLK